MRHRILLCAACALYPATFFISINWYIFSSTQLIILIIGAPIICSFILLGTVYITLFLAKQVFRLVKSSGFSDLPGRFLDPTLAAFSMLLMAFLFRKTIVSLPLPIAVQILIVAAITVLVFGAVFKARLKGLKTLYGFLFVLTLFSLIGYVSNVFSIVNSSSTEWSHKNESANNLIRFSKKPNVYLIVSESYSSKKALEKIYNFDNTPFYQELESKGFSLYHNFYSNYKYTLSSLPSLFAMEHHYYSINLGFFDAIGGRRLIELKDYNPVINIFKNNGYKIQYIHSNNGILPKGADVDYLFPSPSVWMALEIFLTHQDSAKEQFLQSADSEFLKILDTRLTGTVSEDSPYFNFYYIPGPGHSPSRLSAVTWNTKRNEILSAYRDGYYKDVQEANKLITVMVQRILAKDDDPLIIIVGDHGSWGYRSQEDANGLPISARLLTLDRFGVLSAIRFPKNGHERFNGKLKTHVNLFRYVFAFLTENDGVLKTMAPDDSYEDAETMVVKDGKIMSFGINVQAGKCTRKWKHLKREPKYKNECFYDIVITNNTDIDYKIVKMDMEIAKGDKIKYKADLLKQVWGSIDIPANGRHLQLDQRAWAGPDGWPVSTTKFYFLVDLSGKKVMVKKTYLSAP